MKCPLCPKEYQSENDLQIHVKKIHGLTVAVVRQRSEEEKSEFMNRCLELLNQMEKEKKGG
jgi:uncharacterized C2H2 Zn-finger protein